MLESILKRLLRRKVEQKVEKVVEDAFEETIENNRKAAQAQAQANAAQPVSPVAPAAAANTVAEDEWETDYNHNADYFRPIIQANFPEYTLEENVPFAQLVPGVKYQYPPYTFVMRKNGQIALVISLQSKYSYKKGLHTMCEWKAQLRHINFFIEYPDHPEYVINRIRQYLAF